MSVTQPRPRPGGGTVRGVWALRDRPGVAWLLVAIVVAAVHPLVPHATWLMVHAVVLGALTHSVLVWSTHFTQALLKTPDSIDDRGQQSRRLLVLLVGVSAVLIGVPTAQWPLTVAGAVLVSAAVVWHGVQLWRRLRRALPGRFRITVHYYLAAAAFLPVGAGYGATLARELPDPWHGRLLLAHTMTNLLGWIGLTLTGTLITLWPTMLRTRIDDRAERLARRALPVLVVALVVINIGALSGMRLLAVTGLALYGAGLAWWGRALWQPARTRPPKEFAPLSVAASLFWLVIGGVGVTTAVYISDIGSLSGSFGIWSAIFVAGFAAQLLSGALSYLVPSVIGGGPRVLRAGQIWFDRWGTARLVAINLGLAVGLLPVPSLVRVGCSVLVLIALAVFVPLTIGGIRASVRARRDTAHPVGEPPRRSLGSAAAGTRTGTVHRPSVWSPGQAVAGLTAVMVAVTVGVGLDPAAAGFTAGRAGTMVGGKSAVAAAAPVQPTGETTQVTVHAAGMRFTPSSITVPRGNRVVLTVINDDDTTTHDLAVGGRRTPRLAPGEAARLDLGVVGASLAGWCTVVGHRQMGMTFAVVVRGDQSTPPSAVASNDAALTRTVDPVVAPLGTERVHKLTLTAREAPLEVAPGVWQKRWTFNGQVPGPTLHGRVGDVFEVTLVNDGTMGHSIDFHAGSLAPDEPMRTIPPGQSLVYRFTAQRSGIWMYHCATKPMSAHIAAGMHGAVVIEPAAGLPSVDREYVLVQSEVYLRERADAADRAAEVSLDKVRTERPDAVVFNGIANQYDQSQLQARVGERVRFWVLDAGPSRPTSLHIVGGQFDTMYLEGTYLLKRGAGPPDQAAQTDGGAQALGLQPAQGGFVELEFPEPGHYPVISHIMVDAERGAHGILNVTP